MLFLLATLWIIVLHAWTVWFLTAPRKHQRRQDEELEEDEGPQNEGPQNEEQEQEQHEVQRHEEDEHQQDGEQLEEDENEEDEDADELETFLERLDDLIFEEDAFYANELVPGSTYIGLVGFARDERFGMGLQACGRIRAASYFAYSHDIVLAYLLVDAHLVRPFSHGLGMHIYRVVSSPCSIVCVTYYLALVQRHWRAVLRRRRQRVQQRCHVAALAFRRVHGHWPPALRSWPTLAGMLACYQNVGPPI